MFKRVVWMGTGVAVGAGSAVWAKRKVDRAVARYRPGPVARRAGASARTMGRTVRDAATEGRTAMRAREAELRAEIEARTSAPPTMAASRRAPTSQPRPAVARQVRNGTESGQTGPAGRVVGR